MWCGSPKMRSLIPSPCLYVTFALLLLRMLRVGPPGAEFHFVTAATAAATPWSGVLIELIPRLSTRTFFGVVNQRRAGLNSA